MTDAEIDAAVADAKQCTEPNTRGDGPKYIIAGATMWPTLAAHVEALAKELRAANAAHDQDIYALAEAQEENKQLRIEWTDLRAECEASQKQVAHLELQTPGIEQLRRERDRYREALKRIDGQGADTTWAGRVARAALAKEGAK